MNLPYYSATRYIELCWNVTWDRGEEEKLKDNILMASAMR